MAEPSASAAEAEAALADCSLAAQKNAFIAAPHPPPGPGRLPRQPTDIANPAWSMPQEVLLQQSLRNQCMRERGYRLERQAAAIP